MSFPPPATQLDHCDSGQVGYISSLSIVPISINRILIRWLINLIYVDQNVLLWKGSSNMFVLSARWTWLLETKELRVIIPSDNPTGVFPSEPLPPQNLSLTHLTTNSALITWSRHPRHVPDGFVVNVTRGLNTRSRFLPNGKLGSYTLRELTPGQHYHVALMSVKNTGQEQIHSTAQRLSFTTCEWMFPTKRSVAPGLVLPEDGAVESVSQVGSDDGTEWAKVTFMKLFNSFVW